MDRGRWRTRATPERRTPLARRVRRAVTVALLGWFLFDAARPAIAQEGPAFEITVDRQQALFTLTRLLPGPIGARCLVVEVRNGIADAVTMSAVVSGALGPYLSMTVEAGEATDPSTCGGFSGSVQFTGTLAELGARHGRPDSGLTLGLTDRRRIVLRFSMSMADDNTAQGKTADLVLQFDAQDVSEPPTTTTEPTTTTIEPTTTTIEPTTTSAPTTALPTTVVTTPSTTVAPTTTLAAPAVPPDRVTTTSSAERPPRTTRPATVTPSTPTSDPGKPGNPTAPDIVVVDAGGSGAPSISERASEVVKAGVEAAVAAADVTARTTLVPGAFSALALGFLLVQGRLDRNDPKLADAPLEPEPDLRFEPRPTESMA